MIAIRAKPCLSTVIKASSLSRREGLRRSRSREGVENVRILLTADFLENNHDSKAIVYPGRSCRRDDPVSMVQAHEGTVSAHGELATDP